MKKVLFTFFSLCIVSYISAQNTFPSNGNVGIGTSSPSKSLTIQQQSDSDGVKILSAPGNPFNNYMQLGTHPYWPFIYSIWSNGRLDFSSGGEMFFFSNDISFVGNTVITRSGDASSVATQKSSRTMPFQASMYDGIETYGKQVYAGIQNIASTDSAFKHRLAFKVGASNSGMEDGKEVMSIRSDSTVGIGTIETKGYRLAVNGSAIFTKVVVKSYDHWADYVFHPSYKLRPLPEVEDFVKTYQHLPEVPTTADVEKNGVDLGDNQALLLKKVEELTLYLIDQNKRLEQQQAQINLLNKQLLSKAGN